MKKILCFGDSNTYGFNPENGSRFDEKTRWTGLIKSELKNKFEVIEAGVNNRCAFSKNPEGENLIGLIAIEKYLVKKPDIVILAIGINDLQKIYNNDKNAIYEGIKALIQKIKSVNNPDIVLLIPSFIKENILKSFFNCLFDETSIEKSKFLPEIYEKLADEFKIFSLDLNKITETSEFDGLHYSKEGHKKIADSILSFLSAKNLTNF